MTARLERLALRGVRATVLALAALQGFAAPSARAAESAVVMMYHRFGESEYPSTSVTIEQFETHIAELRSGDYTVLPVPQIVAAIKEGRPLPDRTVGITVDDAYLSVYTEAWPRLRAAGLPFTVFVATGPVDAGYKGYMNWDQIRELAAAGVTIGNHTVSHLRLENLPAERVRAEIEGAAQRYMAELGRRPRLFAYPYGEYNLVVRAAVAKAGFLAAFGQQSGVIYRGSDFFALPRFPFSQKYGDLARFRLAANALPLPVRDVVPRDPVLSTNPPPLGFTVAPGIGHLRNIACYASGRGRARVEILEPNRVEVRVSEPFPPGRVRFNCTLRAENNRWRWFGVQYIIPRR